VSFLSSYDLPASMISDGDVYEILAKNPSLYTRMNKLLTFHEVTFDTIDETLRYNKVVTGVQPEILDTTIVTFPANALPNFEMVKSQSFLLEFLPKGVTKAYGIEKLIAHLDIKQSEVMAIGDEANDLPMIEFAGVGVAMKNATDEVKALATYITDDNEHDGVAKAIEKYALGE
jgi:Cof subfamily protein (haloacid dehalogenase superfamily)